MRSDSKKKATQKLALTPHLFGEDRHPSTGTFIIAPMVSSERRKFIPFDIASSEDTIASNLVSIIPNADLYTLGVISSTAHLDWMRLVGSRLESRYRYSGTLVYNTFPFPEVTDKQKQQIEQLAEEILLARASNVGMTLAELYDPDKMPVDLKEAHANLDDAVDKLYRTQGFSNTEDRLAHLLARYENLVAAEKQVKTKKKKT